jgi:hypothetical protein
VTEEYIVPVYKEGGELVAYRGVELFDHRTDWQGFPQIARDEYLNSPGIKHSWTWDNLRYQAIGTIQEVGMALRSMGADVELVQVIDPDRPNVLTYAFRKRGAAK